MAKVLTEIYCKGKTLCLSVLCVMVVLLSFYGCAEKKEAEPKAAKETTALPAATSCELINELPSGVAKPVEVNFGNKVKLLGVTTETMSGKQIKISYYWQLLEDLGKYDTVFVHFEDADHKILIGADRAFCQHKSFAELKGKVIKETQIVAAPQPVPDKELNVMIGIYAATDNNARLKVESASGVAKGDSDTAVSAGKTRF